MEVGSQGKIETTPIVWNGTLYGTSTWSVVYAVDARTGALKWRWDPALVRGGYGEGGPRYCCGPVNRGVAIYEGRVYVGLLDGRLVALDADTGRVAWSVQTTPVGSDYSITGAPRIVKGKVVIGNGGGEYGVRGFLTAYDAETGKQAWRWFVVPGDPAKGLEDRCDGGRAARRGRANGGNTAAAARRGTASPTIPKPIWSTSAPATARRGPRNHRSQGSGDNLYSVVDRRAQRRHRPLRVALPDHARRRLGLTTPRSR